METQIESQVSASGNLRVRRNRIRLVFLSILFALAEFFALSPPIHAQTLLVGTAFPDQGSSGYTSGISVYGVPGALIDTGTNRESAIAFYGNDLLLAENGFVAEYSATNGQLLNPNFVTGLSGYASSMQVSGTALYIQTGGTVGLYDATSGNSVNPSLFTGIAGTMEAASGDKIYSLTSTAVELYDASTGLLSDPTFINGLANPTSMCFSGTNLYVAARNYQSSNFDFTGPGTVASYDPITGALVNGALVTGLWDPEDLTAAGDTICLVEQAFNQLYGFNDNYDSVVKYPGASLAQAYPYGVDNIVLFQGVIAVPEPSPCTLLAIALIFAGAGFCLPLRLVPRKCDVTSHS